jgi:hypothetical protein
MSSSRQRELVAAVAGDGVARPQRPLDPLRDRHQQAVADEVAERVVDELEAIEIAEQDGAAELAALAARALEAQLQAVEEERAVGEAGEAVVERVMAEVGELAQRAGGDDRVGRAGGLLGRGDPAELISGRGELAQQLLGDFAIVVACDEHGDRPRRQVTHRPSLTVHPLNVDGQMTDWY